MSNLSTLPKGDSAWLLRKAIERIIQQVSVLETNIGSSTTGNSTNTQVIFNDNGTLRGDAAFTFVPSTDILTVTGFKTFGTTQLSTIGILYVGTIGTPKLKVDVAGTGITTITQADITGDLTVDTSTLKVDSTNNRVGIGTATPGYTLDVAGPVVRLINSLATADFFLTDSGTTNGNVRLRGESNAMKFITGGGLSATIDSSGNVGVGVASPAAKLDVLGNAALTGTSGFKYLYFNLATDTNSVRGAKIGKNFDSPFDLNIHATTSASGLNNETAINFYRNNTDISMTLDASGNLMVGVASSSNRLDIQKSTDCAVLVKSTGANTNIAMDYVSNYGNHTIRKSGTAVWDFGVINDSSATPAFKFSNGPSAVGVQLVHGATAWTALSDETVKDIIEPITNAITKVGSLRSVIGKFKTDDASKRRSFLIAQDVFAVLPEAVDVVGEKNELGVRYSDVIPLLVAAIKELSAEVNALKNA